MAVDQRLRSAKQRAGPHSQLRSGRDASDRVRRCGFERAISRHYHGRLGTAAEGNFCPGDPAGEFMRSTVDEVGRDDPREAVPAVADMRDDQVGPVDPRRRRPSQAPVNKDLYGNADLGVPRPGPTPQHTPRDAVEGAFVHRLRPHLDGAAGKFEIIVGKPCAQHEGSGRERDAPVKPMMDCVEPDRLQVVARPIGARPSQQRRLAIRRHPEELQ